MFNNEMMLMIVRGVPKYTKYVLRPGSTVIDGSIYSGYDNFMFDSFGTITPSTVEALDGTVCYIRTIVTTTSKVDADYIYCIFQDTPGEDGEYYGNFYIVNLESKVGFLSKAENGHVSVNKININGKKSFMATSAPNRIEFYISETPPPFEWTNVYNDDNHSGGDAEIG